MSIIHDALKKVQQGLSPKTDQSPAPKSETSQKGSAYLYAAPPVVETLPDTAENISQQKPPGKNKIQSILAATCALLITTVIIIVSIDYIYKEFNSSAPSIQDLIRKSYYTLLRKEPLFGPKTAAPAALVPLAKITVNPPPQPITSKATVPTNIPTPPPTTIPAATVAASPTTPSPTNSPVIVSTVQPDPPQTLNIHGVMANGSGNLVLINDQVYQEGDDVDGVKILKISLSSIKVINNGKEETIPVKN